MAKTGGSSRPGSEFTSQVYRATALERAGALAGLYAARQYGLAVYVAGVAVEAMFRAYRMAISPEFSSRHDLSELAKESRFAERVPAALQERYAALLGSVAVRWSNNHRYRSEAAMRSFFKRAHLDRKIKGDFLKENARIIINASVELVAIGDRAWKSSSST